MNKNNRIWGWLGTIIMLLCSHVVCTAVRAEPAISVLMSHDSAPYQAVLDGFQGYLRDKGVQADYEVMHIKEVNDKQLAEQINQQDVALIYCLGGQACQFAQQLTPRRPIVASMVLTSDSILTDAQSTGVFLTYSPETQLQWLKKLFPHIKRVGVIYNPEENQAQIDAAIGSARQLGLELVAEPIDTSTWISFF